MDILKMLLPIIVLHITVLVVIVIVMKRMLLNQTMTAVDRVKQVETDIRKKEEAIRREIEEHEAEFARKKTEGEQVLQKQKDDAEKEIARTREAVVAEAKKEADRLLDQAKRNEEKFRQQIAQDMEEKAVKYGGQVFQMVFSEKMTDELNKQFINELLDALDEIDPASITIEGSQAEFVASHSLAADQKQRIEQLIADKFNVTVKVNEKIRKDLMAGITFKLGSLEIDGSLLNRYNEAVQEVLKSAHV